MCHGRYCDRSVSVRSDFFVIVAAATADVRQFSNVSHRVILCKLCLLGSNLASEYLYLVNAWSLHLFVW